MKEKGARKYQCYWLWSNAEKDKWQRQNAWMLYRWDVITDNDPVQKINSEKIQILEALKETITFHKLWKALIGKVPRE